MSDADPRFTLANERTFLAWVRTALGFVAGATALEALDLPWPGWVVTALAVVLALTGALCVVLAWVRWRYVDRSIELGRDVRMGSEHLVLSVAVGVVAVAVVLLALF